MYVIYYIFDIYWCMILKEFSKKKIFSITFILLRPFRGRKVLSGGDCNDPHILNIILKILICFKI